MNLEFYQLPDGNFVSLALVTGLQLYERNSEYYACDTKNGPRLVIRCSAVQDYVVWFDNQTAAERERLRLGLAVQEFQIARAKAACLEPPAATQGRLTQECFAPQAANEACRNLRKQLDALGPLLDSAELVVLRLEELGLWRAGDAVALSELKKRLQSYGRCR